MQITRFPTNPIITPEMDERIGRNINGPSLIRVPGWVPDPLGRYYLYFAHHQGDFIRLAYADDLAGPWTIHSPGTLHLDQTPCHGHIASPDVRGETLFVFYSVAGACPEQIVCATVDLTPDWRDWTPSPPVPVLAPETVYEGADLPLTPSQRGAVHERARQLRDPYLYEENKSTYLLYAVAGEQGIAIANVAF